jgi:hypothetical protein
MEYFNRLDIENDEHPIQKYPRENWYGKKEIPNILLTVYDRLWDSKEKHEVYFDQLTQYYEKYDSKTGWKIVLEMSLLSPKVYALLTRHHWLRWTTQADNFWRSAETGKDEAFIEPEINFNRFKIEHKLQCEGDPTRWYITLWNERETMPSKEPAKLKEVDL